MTRRAGSRQGREAGLRALRLATWLGAFPLALLAASDVAAQAPFLLVPVQELQFGQLAPGVRQAVAPTDVARRAEITLEGRGATTVILTLPQYLEGPAGAQIPLVFSATDGLLEIKNRLVVFDPAQPVLVRINPSEGFARIFLGGTALPAPGQRAGSYGATLTIMTVHTGT